MKIFAAIIAFSLALPLAADNAAAQGHATPLTIQGTDNLVDVGARARAMGGAHVGSQLGAASIFFDPAGLALLNDPELRVGALTQSKSYEQDQEWLPNRFYVELSLILENNPVAVNQPYDDIVPDWEHRQSDSRPSLVTAAMPFRVGGVGIVAGLGYATVVDLNHYFQNNNVLDPNIGRFRPEPIPRVTQGDSLMVRWFQHHRERRGFINSITPAIAIEVSEGISLGASLSLLSGSSDDRESRWDRGEFTLRYNNDMDLAPANFNGSAIGTSDYSGLYATFSCRYATRYFQIGASLRTPFEIERDWKQYGTIEPGNDASGSYSGRDIIEMPMMVSMGVSLLPSERWILSASVDRRGFDDVTYRPNGNGDISPWVEGNSVRFGVQFQATPWLAVRGGHRDTAESFAAEGAGLMSDPVRGSVLSGGVGLLYNRFGVDLAYEYLRTSYTDRWLSNVNRNEITQHTFVFETYVRF